MIDLKQWQRDLLVLGIAALFSVSSSSADDEGFVLSGAVQAALADQIVHAQNGYGLLRVVRVDRIENSANSNASMVLDARSTLDPLENGLFAVSSVLTERSGKLSGQASSLTLCGLITLLTQTSANIKNNYTSVVPIAGVFVPFGVKSSTDWGSRFRVTAFEASSKNICNPQPGTEFEYRVDADRELKMSSMFSTTKNLKETDAFVCRVSATESPGSALSPAVKGTYLTVVCTSTEASTVKKRVELAYITDLAYYFSLDRQEGTQSTRTELSGIELSK